MKGRTRLSRYGAVALWAVAQCAFSTPSRVPDPPARQEVANQDAPPGELQPDAVPGMPDGVDHRHLRRDELVALLPLDAAPLGPGGVRRAGGTRVAEPSTLLLVSFGLFGLIAWSRRRR